MNPETVDASVVQRMMELHSGEIPEHIMHRNPVRTGQEFDPNTYFTILTHLAMKSGYVLDYVYNYDGSFGLPCIYARGVHAKPFASGIEYLEWTKECSVDSFLVADGSPDGFFQLTVFRVLAGQFYLWWHANYRDTRIVTTTDEMDAILSVVKGNNFEGKVTDEQLSSMKAINPQPTVEVSDERASVTYCTFTKWGGFSSQGVLSTTAAAPTHKHRCTCRGEV